MKRWMVVGWGSLWMAVCVLAVAYQHPGNRKGSTASSPPALVVKHIPNPCAVCVWRRFRRGGAYVWYYRTEVRNSLKVPLQITHFECYTLASGQWRPTGNVLGHPLGSKEFAAWYTEGAPTKQGWIGPGKVAACDPNYCYNSKLIAWKMKWVFTAQDKQGHRYRGEAVVDLRPPQK